MEFLYLQGYRASTIVLFSLLVSYYTPFIIFCFFIVVFSIVTYFCLYRYMYLSNTCFLICINQLVSINASEKMF